MDFDSIQSKWEYASTVSFFTFFHHPFGEYNDRCINAFLIQIRIFLFFEFHTFYGREKNASRVTFYIQYFKGVFSYLKITRMITKREGKEIKTLTTCLETTWLVVGK